MDRLYWSIAEKTRDEVVLLLGIKAIEAALEIFEKGKIADSIEKAGSNLATTEALLAEIRRDGSAA